jgi:protein phosphatase
MFDNIRHGEKTDIGLLRHNNEDSFIIIDKSSVGFDLQKNGMLFVVADGIGGHAAGEIASRMACEQTISAYYGNEGKLEDGRDASTMTMERLEKAIRTTHDNIVDFANARAELRGMGTTLSALLLKEDKAFIAHVGDSRIYRCRNAVCDRMTVDHTKKQELIDLGRIEPNQENIRYFDYYGHIITQAIGGYDDLGTIFTRTENLQPGDLFLLCTDGLHDRVTDEEIQGILTSNTQPQAACDELVRSAIERGGHDNVTVIVIQV